MTIVKSMKSVCSQS